MKGHQRGCGLVPAVAGLLLLIPLGGLGPATQVWRYPASCVGIGCHRTGPASLPRHPGLSRRGQSVQQLGYDRY